MNILTLAKHDGTTIRIVGSESELTDTLFCPIDGRHTADGYLLKPTKREQRFMIGQQLYCINTHGCLIKGSKTPDGIFWQHQIEFTRESSEKFADQVTKGKDEIGRWFK